MIAGHGSSCTNQAGAAANDRLAAMGAVPALGGLMQMGPVPVARGGLTPTASPAARELLQVRKNFMASTQLLLWLGRCVMQMLCDERHAGGYDGCGAPM